MIFTSLFSLFNLLYKDCILGGMLLSSNWSVGAGWRPKIIIWWWYTNYNHFKGVDDEEYNLTKPVFFIPSPKW